MESKHKMKQNYLIKVRKNIIYFNKELSQSFNQILSLIYTGNQCIDVRNQIGICCCFLKHIAHQTIG